MAGSLGLYVGVGLLALAGLYGVVGWQMEAVQRVRMEVPLPAPPDVVWGLVAVPQAQTWRSDLERVEPGAEGRWVEVPRSGPPVRFQQVRAEKPGVLDMAFEGQGFSGVWRGTLEPAQGGGTLLKFTEEVTVHNPWMRPLARVLASPEKTMGAYVADLRRALEKR
jgi:hypothetical protein